MIDQETRRTILKLYELGYSTRNIARTVRVSRTKVREIIAAQTDVVPSIKRPTVAEQHRQRILSELHACRGNQRRVHEELTRDGIDISYSALTHFVRTNHLLKPAPLPAGRYVTRPGLEAQHDTSPHDVKFQGGIRRCQCASIVLAYSRLLYFAYFPRFTRFECKLILTDALKYFEGVFERCIVDNTHVVILHGTGRDAVIAPEMDSFGQRFGFRFLAHEVGDANRSGKVERPFRYIETNFLVGRVFKDFNDLNQQARAFCDRNNSAFKRHLKARPVELYATEKPLLKPLPPHIPPVYRLYHRTVDLEGYINVHTNAYSVPYQLIGRKVEVRETRERIQVFLGPREVAVHDRFEDGAQKRSTNKKHRPTRQRGGKRKQEPIAEERILRARSQSLDAYVDAIKKRSPGRAVAPLRRLNRMLNEYPEQPFFTAVQEALHFKMTDLERLDKMILRNIAGEYFRLSLDDEKEENSDE